MTDRELADAIWMIVKGRKVPENWTDEDIQAIIVRYWSKAIAKAEG